MSLFCFHARVWRIDSKTLGSCCWNWNKNVAFQTQCFRNLQPCSCNSSQPADPRNPAETAPVHKALPSAPVLGSEASTCRVSLKQCWEHLCTLILWSQLQEQLCAQTPLPLQKKCCGIETLQSVALSALSPFVLWAWEYFVPSQSGVGLFLLGSHPAVVSGHC